MNNEQKIEKFLEKELNSGLQEVFISQDNFGNFELFNQFKIIRQNNGLYKVIPYNLTDEKIFSTLKNAFAYCTFKRLNRFSESNRIEKLDYLLDSIDTLILQQKKVMSKSKDVQVKYIYMAKIHETKLKKTALLQELKTYINISRYHQINRFLRKQPK